MSARKRPQNGKPSSTPAVPRSASEIIWPTPELQKVLGKVYDAYQKLDDPVVNAACRQDFIFHMTDWLSDLRRLASLYDHPKDTAREDAEDTVFGFIIHAVPHLLAAGHLLTGKAVTHPFELPIDRPEQVTKTHAPSRRRRRPSPSPR